MASLLDLIEELGIPQVAEDLEVDRSYVSKLKTGAKPVSAALLARAKGRYGDKLDVDKTLRELRADDFAVGERGAAAAHTPDAGA